MLKTREVPLHDSGLGDELRGHADAIWYAWDAGLITDDQAALAWGGMQ